MTDTLTWLTREDLRELGFRPAAPEVDLGTGWGGDRNLRVSFAPRGEGGDGFLYAYAADLDRYAVLCPETTAAAVDAASKRVSHRAAHADGHLALAAELAGPEIETSDAVALWMYCVEAEIVARRRLECLGPEQGPRFEAARGVVLSQAARVSTEDLIIGSLTPRECDFGAPAIVRYRVSGRDGWTGRVVGSDLTDAAFRTADLHKLADEHGYQIQATSFTQGHVHVAAARLPELEFAAAPLTVGPTSSISF